MKARAASSNETALFDEVRRRLNAEREEIARLLLSEEFVVVLDLNLCKAEWNRAGTEGLAAAVSICFRRAAARAIRERKEACD